MSLLLLFRANVIKLELDEDDDKVGRGATLSFDEDDNSNAEAGGDGIVSERMTTGMLKDA